MREQLAASIEESVRALLAEAGDAGEPPAFAVESPRQADEVGGVRRTLPAVQQRHGGDASVEPGQFPTFDAAKQASHLGRNPEFLLMQDVHGGFVAATFDEVLGFVQSLGGNPGMTGTLTVKYRRPTPLHTELIIEAELVRIDGRKIFTEGRILANGVVTAEAEGLFISIDHSNIAALLEAREGYERRRQG